jgi:hypothetical protein
MGLLIQDRCELKIDQAEPSVGLAVGDIPHLRIIVPDPVFQQLLKQLAAALAVEVLDPAPAVARDNF